MIKATDEKNAERMQKLYEKGSKVCAVEIDDEKSEDWFSQSESDGDELE